jgi:hypothetical protein
MVFFPRDTLSTKRCFGCSHPQALSVLNEKGFHFEAGYDCHESVIEPSSGLCARVMNDKNVPGGMNRERSNDQ